MNCNEARDLFSPWIDNEIDNTERLLLKEHLQICPACAKELEAWKDISQSLRQLSFESLTAPAGFSNSLMQKLEKEKKPARFGNWKQIAAGLAAAMALFLGANSLWINPAVQVADNRAPVVVKQNEVNKLSGQTSTGNIAETNKTAFNPTGPATSPDTKDLKDNHSVVQQVGINGADKIAMKNSNLENANSNVKSNPVFLSKERVLVSTVYKVLSNDPIAAPQQAVNLAASYGATVQYLGEQPDGSRSSMVLKFSCPVERAPLFKQDLLGLGKRLSLEENRQSLTSRFDENLEQYRVLNARLAIVQDAQERVNLGKQLKSLEEQLSSIDAESKQEIIVVWLES